MDFKTAHIHSANLLITLLLITFLVGLFCIIKNLNQSKIYKILLLISLIFSHIQLIFGGINFWKYYSKIESFKDVMGDSALRMRFIEHPVVMITSIVLITYSYILFKRNPEDKKTKYIISSLYAISIALILFVVTLMSGKFFPWGV